MPEGASRARPVPAVVLLHGSGGILPTRELTYGPQYAAMGVAALVPEVFASRRDIATGYVDRVLRITETMMVADAYAALRALAARPGIDPRRVAVIGYSAGALATLLAAYEQVAEKMSPGGLRFAAHVSYYGACLARFEDSRATGAPLLLLQGTRDRVTDPVRCDEAAGQLRDGGTTVDIVRYDTYHQWDGRAGTMDSPVRRSRNLAGCRFEVERDGTARDLGSGVAMSNLFWRRVILLLCADSEGYQQARNDAVRTLSDAEVGRFLARAFAKGAPQPKPLAPPPADAAP
jgi:dienelactone hydrolase